MSARHDLRQLLKKIDLVRNPEAWTNLSLALDTWSETDLKRLHKELFARPEIQITYLEPKC